MSIRLHPSRLNQPPCVPCRVRTIVAGHQEYPANHARVDSLVAAGNLQQAAINGVEVLICLLKEFFRKRLALQKGAHRVSNSNVFDVVARMGKGRLGTH